MSLDATGAAGNISAAPTTPVTELAAADTRREAELRNMLSRTEEANAWLEMAAEIAQVGHWRLARPNNTLTWSTEVFRIHGVTPETYAPVLETALDFFHPDDRSEVRRTLAEDTATGAPFDFTARIVRRDGDIRHVVVRGVTRVGQDGRADVVFGVIRDFTLEHSLQHALRVANARLDLIAHEDFLTGLANRRRFDETLEREWRRAQRDRQPISLAMIDVDFFKPYNDHYGHLAGDACLQRIAACTTKAARRPGDVAARYGGEELALILPSTNLLGAEEVANRLRAAIQALGIPHEHSPAGGVVTASIGVVTAYPPGAPGLLSPADLVADADRLLYQAKRAGRNRVVTAASLLVQRQGALPADSVEAERLATLAAYESRSVGRRSMGMDRIARLAATLTGTPAALVTLVGKDEQIFIGNFGLEHVAGTPRNVSFCSHTICTDEPMVVADATLDPRFKDNPLVTGELGLRYYAGAPIVSPRNGHRLGAVCVLDKSAHAHTGSADRAVLKDLANMAAELLEEAASVHDEITRSADQSEKPG